MALSLIPIALLLAQTPTPPEPPSSTEVELRPGKGLTVKNESAGFELAMRGRFQVLGSYAEVESGEVDLPPAPDAMIRRARLQLTGKFAHEFRYYLQLGFAPSDIESGTNSALRDAYVQWSRLRDLNIRAGQGKVPFDHQRVTSSGSQQFVDRSLIVRELTLDRDVGLTLLSDDFLGLEKKLSYRLGVFGGEGRNRTTRTPGLLYVARMEYAPLGAFNSLDESDFERTPGPRVAVGGAVGYSSGTRRELATTGDFFTTGVAEYRHATADLHFKWMGASFLTSAIWRDAVEDVVGVTDAGVEEYARSGWGLLVQGGYFVSPTVELAARFSQLRPSGGNRSDLALGRELGAGTSWYISGRELKLQADYFYAFQDDFSVGDHLFRVMTQLWF